MVRLQTRLSELEKAGIQVVAISYDSTDVLAEFAENASVTYPLLSDPKSKAITAYGVRNEDVKGDPRQDGIPHPGTFLVDKHGKIQAKLFYSVRKRHTADELLDAMKQLSP